jgi:RHS repeat-associated protein
MSVVAQYAPDGSRQAWYTQSLARIDEVLSVVNGQGKFWYQTDALGSTYALANGSGAVVARGGYDVFGDAVAVSGNVSQPLGFTGREHERDSGLLNSRQRYMQASLGRWTAADPLGFADGPNAYGYVGGRPTRATDPEGLVGLIQAVGFVSSNLAIDAGMRYVNLAGDAGDDDGLVDFYFSYGLSLIAMGITVAVVSGNCGGGGGAPKGLAAQEAEAALTGMRNQGGHAIRHLIQEGLIVNKGSLASQVERFRELVTPILTGPKKVFDWTVGATPGIGYLGEVGGKNVLVIVAKSGQWAGKVIAAIIPDAQQLAIMLAKYP